MRWSVFLVVAAAAVGASCSAAKDPVQALLDELVAAAEARDAGRFAERLGEGFQGQGGMPRAEARATLQRYFAGYASVGVTLFDVQAESPEHVVLRVDFSGRPRDVGGLAGLLPSEAAYSFDLTLASEGGGLVVSRASWEPYRAPR